MQFKEHPYYSRFESLLREIGHELEKLRMEKNALLQENRELRETIENLKNSGNGMFSHLSEDQKEEKRKEISQLIHRLDKHISSQQ